MKRLFIIKAGTTYTATAKHYGDFDTWTLSVLGSLGEPNHMFRIGRCAQGVQFHPEYDCRIMRSYIREQSENIESKEYNVMELMDGVIETPFASQILKNFASFVSRIH